MHESGRPELSDEAEPAPESTTPRSTTTPPTLHLQSAPYPLTYTNAPGVQFPLRGGTAGP
jgi:hypothetical protein